MRRSGAIPYGWITDATRRGYFVSTYNSAGEFIERMHGFYRADLWRDNWAYPEVWVESRSIAAVIQNECEELAVSLYPAGGFTSISLAHEAAKMINYEHGGREVVIFYIGDFDPAGVLIDVSLEKELRLHLKPDVSLRFERIAITREQIEAYSLPSKPRKASDRRSPEITATVEAEAMPAGILRRLLRYEIEALLPDNALEVARIAEESEKAQLARMADLLQSDGGA